MSSKILKDLLRRRLGFTGMVVSDDLEMNAIAGRSLLHEAGIEAIFSGVDLLLVCKSLERQEQVFESIARNWVSSNGFQKRSREALGRIRNVKQRYLRWMLRTWPSLPRADGWPVHRRIAGRIRGIGAPKVV